MLGVGVSVPTVSHFEYKSRLGGSQFSPFDTMGGKKDSVSLVAFTPSPDELQAARTLLKHADSKQKKAKINSMNVFLKTNDNPDNAGIVALPAAKRAEYIAKYMAYQMAKKSGTLTNQK